MKYEEVFTPSRLTPEAKRSYARSMPDQLENHEISTAVPHAANGSAEHSPEDVLKTLLANGDATVREQLQKIQSENDKAAKTSGGEEKKDANTTDNQQTVDAKADTTDKSDGKLDLTESSPKASLFGAILNAVKGTLSDEKLVKRVDAFTKSYDSLKKANLNDLKEEYQSWTPPEDKNDPNKVVYMVVQKYIADMVEERGDVPLSVFLQAANADRDVNVSEVLAQATEGASTGVERAMNRFMVALDEKPVEEWSTEELAEELVAFKDAVADAGEGNALNQEIEDTVEDFVIHTAEKTGVRKEEFEKVVEQVEDEKEDIVLTHSPVREAVKEASVQDEQEEDRVIEVKPAVTHDAVHSFEKEESIPLPKTLSSGNDPEMARQMWLAYNRGKELTSEQRLLASRGYMPMLMGGSALPKEEPRSDLHVLPPAGNVVSTRREAVRADEEDDETEETEKTNVIPFRTREERAAAAAAQEAEDDWEDAYEGLDDDDGEYDVIRAEETKADIPNDWTGLKPFVAKGAQGTLRVVLERAKTNPELQMQIQADYSARANEILALEKDGKLDEAKQLTASLVDRMDQVYRQLEKQRREKIPSGRFETGGGGNRGFQEMCGITVETRNGYLNPTSMNELAAIIGDAEAQYAPGGDHQMLDENGNFIEENFMYWVQEKFSYFDGQDPDSIQRFFDLIQIENPSMMREITVNSLLRQQNKFFKTKGRIDAETGKLKSEKLDGLFNYLTDWVWLVGTIRNVNVEYIQQMSDDNKIGELIASVMKSNVLTKRSAGKENTLEAVATLSSSFRDWENKERVNYDIDKVIIASRMKGLADGDYMSYPDAVNYFSTLKGGITPEEIKQLIKDARDDENIKPLLADENLRKQVLEKIRNEEQNIDVGDGVAVGYLMYYNIQDYDYLYNKFGGEDNTHFFTQAGMEAVLRKLADVSYEDFTNSKTTIQAKAKLANYLARGALIGSVENKDEKERAAMYDAFIKSWYYSKADLEEEDTKKAFEKDPHGEFGHLKASAKSDFLSMLNVFLPQKNANQNDITKNLIQLVIAERLDKHREHKKVYGTIDEKVADLLKDASAGFAERLASYMTFFTGAAARNDIGVNAVNAASKMRWIDNYKKKQGANSRAGGWGNLYNIGTIRSSYVDMMIGMPTVSGKNIIEIFEEKEEALRTNKPFEKRSEISSQLLFNLNDAKQYGAAGPTNMIKVFHQEIEGQEIDFHKFIHVDPITGHLSYKPDAMLAALQDAIIKPTRYAWSTNKVPFEKIVRIMTSDKNPPTYRTGTQLEDMFNPQLLRVIQKTYFTSNKEKDTPQIPTYLRKEGFLTKDGKVKRYATNAKGEFIDANGNAIPTPKNMKCPDPKKEPVEYVKWNQEMAAWHKKLVLDMSDEGKLDPMLNILWDDTSFRRCVVKGYLINRFAGQLYGHTTSHSPYEYLSYGLREDIIQGLAHIPIDPEDHGEFDSKHIGGYYFTADDIKMLRNLSKNQLWRNVPLALGRDVRHGLLDALKEYWARIWKASSAGI